MVDALCQADLTMESSVGGKLNRQRNCREMTEAAQKTISDVRETISELEARVAALESCKNDPSENERRVLSERVTQALLKVDGIDDISKGAAASALRAKDHKTAKTIAVLIARKKAVVKELNALGDRIDRCDSKTLDGSATDRNEAVETTSTK